MTTGTGVRWLAFAGLVAATPVVGIRPYVRSAGGPDTVGFERTIREVLAAGRHSAMRWPAIGDAAAVVESLAGSNGWRFRWTRAGKPTPAAEAALQALRRAGEWGLEPADYDADSLVLWGERLRRTGEGDGRALALFETALSVDVARLVAALASGRPPNAAIAPGPRPGVTPTSRGPAPPPPLARLVDSVSRAPLPAAWFDQLAAPTDDDRALLGFLRRYRQLAADSTVEPPEFGGRVLKPGGSDPAVGALRRFLVAVGDLEPAVAASATAASDYGDDLVAGVRRFQARHGLDVDGVVGRATAIALGRPLSDRVRQIELALERRRWLPRPLPLPAIVVNVPAFGLVAIDSSGERLSMAVVAGQAREHETPTLSAWLSRVVFQPWWEVPTSIMKAEIRPKALRDSTYLAREGMELWLGDEVVPATRQFVRRIGQDVRVRQRPGPRNALGRVKFLLPNPHSVFLHDTPARGLFARSRRDFSHGCVRVAEPAQLAWFVLRDQVGWTADRVTEAMAGEETFEVELPRPIPVFVVYQPVTVGAGGSIHFAPDIYDLDRRLDMVLRAGYPYRTSLP